MASERECIVEEEAQNTASDFVTFVKKTVTKMKGKLPFRS